MINYKFFKISNNILLRKLGFNVLLNISKCYDLIIIKNYNSIKLACAESINFKTISFN